MKQIKLVRIDDRLIHAQITLIWMKHSNINHIIIVDDNLVSNPFLVQVFKLTTPPYIQLNVFTVEQMIEYYQREKNNVLDKTNRIMILVKNVDVAMDLHKHGLDIKEMQLANYVHENLKKGLTVSEQIETLYPSQLEYIRKNQLILYYQNAPKDQKIYI